MNGNYVVPKTLEVYDINKRGVVDFEPHTILKTNTDYVIYILLTVVGVKKAISRFLIFHNLHGAEKRWVGHPSHDLILLNLKLDRVRVSLVF